MSTQEEITLSEQDLAERGWNQDGLHFSHPLSPLYASYMIPAMTEGTRPAMEALKAPMRQFIAKIHQGYFYQSVVPAEGDPETILQAHRAVVEPLLGTQQNQFQQVLNQDIWPLHNEIDGLSAHMATAADAIRGLERLQEIYRKFWELHFRIVLPRNIAGLDFEQTYRAAFPDRNPLEAYELLTGVMNKSLEQDRALWNLAAIAKRSPAVLRAFDEDRVYPALIQDPATAPFRQALAEYLEIYGWRTVYVHEFLYETWRENPEYCLTVLKGYVHQDFDFDRHWHQVVTTREQRVEAMLSRVNDPSLRNALAQSHERALEVWSIDEDHHFYIDAMLPARSRQFCLRVGDWLVAHDLIGERDLVFFFYLDELLSTLRGDVLPHLDDVLKTRRRTLDLQFAETPTPHLGRESDASAGRPDFVSARVFGAGSPSLEGATREVRGFAASPGSSVGLVRIVRGPEEFFKVQPGDILVCRNTAPSWTGLFAIAGAVVTETGGILSHAATVAREYQIPCIVGTREATHVFHDGERVAVNGTTGIAVADG